MKNQMKHNSLLFLIIVFISPVMADCLTSSFFISAAVAQEIESPESPESPVTAAARPSVIDGSGPGWVSLGGSDFTNVNCKEDTWSWTGNAALCNGNCVGVIRTNKQYENFELMLQWKHLQKAGNSGVFIWSPKSSLDNLAADKLPEGIECQVLDHGYTEQYETQSGKKADWFTTNGDVFPVGNSKMKPFPPLSPNGVRSFPSADHSLGVKQWNQYYIRAINGEVRLWVNGHEVSGGNGCNPANGFIALEAEGAPIEFRNVKIRVLP